MTGTTSNLTNNICMVSKGSMFTFPNRKERVKGKGREREKKKLFKG